MFDSDSALVDIRTPQDSVTYSLKLPNYIAPEGPGMPVFLASLPLKENYSIFYYQLNRWSGESPKTGELQQTYLKVIGIETLTIEEKEYETYVLEITTEKGKYTKIWALKEAPHYWVKVDHKLSEDETINSKVIKLIIVKP